MKHPLSWIGVAWIALVMISVAYYFISGASEFLDKDQRNLVFVIPAAVVAFAIAWTLAIPGFLLLSAAKPKRPTQSRPQYGGKTLDQIMADNAVSTDATKHDPHHGSGGA